VPTGFTFASRQGKVRDEAGQRIRSLDLLFQVHTHLCAVPAGWKRTGQTKEVNEKSRAPLAPLTDEPLICPGIEQSPEENSRALPIGGPQEIEKQGFALAP
jgi:hypothetical protein